MPIVIFPVTRFTVIIHLIYIFIARMASKHLLLGTTLKAIVILFISTITIAFKKFVCANALRYSLFDPWILFPCDRKVEMFGSPRGFKLLVTFLYGTQNFGCAELGVGLLWREVHRNGAKACTYKLWCAMVLFQDPDESVQPPSLANVYLVSVVCFPYV